MAPARRAPGGNAHPRHPAAQAPAVEDDRVLYSCPRCGRRFTGFFRPDLIEHHRMTHKEEDRIRRNAQRRSKEEQDQRISKNKSRNGKGRSGGR